MTYFVNPAKAAGATAGEVTQFTVPGLSGQELTAITSGPDGNLWFTQRAANTIVKMTPAGVQTTYSEGITPNSQPTSLATGPDGNVWFAEANAYDPTTQMFQIAKITSDGVVTEYPTPVQPPAGLQGMVSGPDNSIWYVSALGGKIAKVAMDGTVTVFPTGLSPFTFMFSLAVGPDGNLWFSGVSGSTTRFGKMTPTGTVTLYTSGGITSAGIIGGITAGPDGNVWFTKPGVGEVSRITTDGQVTNFSSGITPGASPVGITTGADGNLWLSEAGTGATPTAPSAVAWMTTDGDVTEFPVGPYATNDLSGITPGSDGNVWSVGILEPNIYRVTTGEAAANSNPVVSGITPTSANVSGIVYPGAASSAVTLQCANNSTFTSIAYSRLATSGSPATGTTASRVSGRCTGLTPGKNLFARFVSANTFPGSQWTSAAYTTITKFSTSANTKSRQKQSLQKNAVPKRIKNSGTTLINKRNAKTRQGLPLSARVVARYRSIASRGEISCLRTRYGAKRKVTLRTSGQCRLQIRVRYTAPGTKKYYPLKKTVTFKTKRVR